MTEAPLKTAVLAWLRDYEALGRCKVLRHNALKTAVLAWLRDYEALGRCKVLRHNAGKRGGVTMGERGRPDIEVLVRHGRTVWLEVKRPGNWKRSSNPKTIEAQAKWRADAERLGHVVHTVQSVQDAISAVLSDSDVGNQADNMRDMAAKGRSCRGMKRSPRENAHTSAEHVNRTQGDHST